MPEAGAAEPPGDGDAGVGSTSGTASRTAEYRPSFVAQTSVAGASSPAEHDVHPADVLPGRAASPASRYCSMYVPLALSIATTRSFALS